jgi:LPLT family lysophospholipid transporter-like MFS transporter
MPGKAKFGITPLNAVVLTQFLSSFADNLNFFLIVGMVKRHGVDNPDAYVAYIQVAFLLAYVILAPIVGAYADKTAKSRVLLIGNLVKGAGVTLLLFGTNPVICYLLVGIGAVVFSPAKYGILTELTNTESELLKANAKIEGTTILAILLGTVGGGLLAKNADLPAIVASMALYLISLLMTLIVPVRRGDPSIRYGAASLEFLRDVRKLFSSRRARFSLIGTSAFWLAATVLRIALIAWLPVNLGITDTDQQSMIIGITAVGVVVSAFLTPRLVPEGKLHRAFFYGLLMVTAVVTASFLYSLWLTVTLLFLIGIFGGIFLIPLNTMLQEEGKSLVGPGKTIAVQNLVENTLTVTGLILYMIAISLNVPINWAVVGVGLVLLSFILYLATQFSTVSGTREAGGGVEELG